MQKSMSMMMGLNNPKDSFFNKSYPIFFLIILGRYIKNYEYYAEVQWGLTSCDERIFILLKLYKICYWWFGCFSYLLFYGLIIHMYIKLNIIITIFIFYIEFNLF